MDNNKIIEKIKNEKLKPISRNIFIIKKISIWFFLIMVTVFGSYSFALFFLKTLFIEFDKWYYLHDSYGRFLIENIPIFWIISFIISLILIFYLFKNTNKGYKYSITNIGLISICISFIFGVFLAKNIIYNDFIINKFEKEKIINWTKPESGRLSGEILFLNNNYVLIRDIKNRIWNVNIDYILDHSRQILNENQFISIIGIYDYEDNFTACQIMPFDIDKRNFKYEYLNKTDYIDFEKKDYHVNSIKNICDFVIKNH